MRKLLLTTAMAAVLAAPALARADDCRAKLESYQKELETGDTYRRATQYGVQREIRRLRDAAYILESAGQDEACQEVVDAIRDMMEHPEKHSATDVKKADMKDWDRRQSERLELARNIDEMKRPLRVNAMIGADVRNPQNEDLGEISNVLLHPTDFKLSYAILSHGGFLGLGEKQIAVPLDHLKVTADGDTYVLNMSEEQVEKAPRFNRNDWSRFDDATWSKMNRDYYTKTHR